MKSMRTLSLAAVLASSWLTAVALPITSSPPADSVSAFVEKREAGPGIGGANFPGKSRSGRPDLPSSSRVDTKEADGLS